MEKIYFIFFNVLYMYYILLFTKDNIKNIKPKLLIEDFSIFIFGLLIFSLFFFDFFYNLFSY